MGCWDVELAAKSPRWHGDSTQTGGGEQSLGVPAQPPELQRGLGHREERWEGVGCQRQKAGYRDAPGKNLAFPMLREPLGTVTPSWASPLCLYPSATLQPCSKPWGASKYKPPDPRLAGRGSGGTCLQPGGWVSPCSHTPSAVGLCQGRWARTRLAERPPGGQWEPLEPPRAPRPGCAQRALLFSHLSELQRAKWIFTKCY